MMWWSGALGIITVVHLGRAIIGVPVTIGTIDVPIWASVMVGLITAAAALWLWWAADEPARLSRIYRAPRKEEPRRPDKLEVGDEHQADAPCCGIHAAVAADEDADFVDEDG